MRLPALLAVAGLAAAVSAPVSDVGVSHDLATRRAALVSGVRYDLTLNVTNRDTARGRVLVQYTAKRADEVVLDFRGPTLTAATANGTRLAASAWNGAHVRVPAALVRAGSNTVELAFTTPIAPAGASIIRFHDETDGSEYLYTLLVPADANLLFPCFDQPDLKARLALTLTVPRGWRALANGMRSAVDSNASTTTYRFRETDPLPTYLFAFAAGPWTSFTGGPAHTTFWARRSRAAEVEVDSLQDQVASALASLADYFGVPYPFQQFQYMLSPAFPFGGMEHPGATMFNEESFIYREPPTLNQRLGRRATIYHEVAHHWFGDYVTMQWFDDLWLKEGFATYMAAKMQEVERQRDSLAGRAAHAPSPWMSFYLRNKPAAYDVDQTSGTTPVWQELGNLDQAKSNYGAIVYNKAPGVLKQLNYLVGDSAFRTGVHNFLVKHAYANATWQDLLSAIGEAAHRPLGDWGRQYILRPGMPVIEQQLDLSNGTVRRLALVQRAAQRMSGRGIWPIRTEVVLWRADAPPTRLPVEIRAETTVVAAAAGQRADFVFANAGDNAYALVTLDPRSAAWLEHSIGTVTDPFLRAMLWGALWDLVRDARLAPAAFIAAAMRELPRETDEQIAARIIAGLTRATEAYLSTAQRDSMVGSVEQLLLAGAGDASKSYGLRKSQLDAFIGLAQSSPGVARLNAWLDSTTSAGIPLRQPTRWSIVTQLVSVGAPGAEARLAAEARRDSTTGGQRRAFIAGAARPSAAVKRDYFTRYFADSTLNEDWVTGSLGAFNNADQGSLTLPYLTPALDSLPWIQKNRRIFFLGNWLGAFIRGQRSAEGLARVDAFLSSHPNLPNDLRQKILQTRDELERTVRIRQRYALSA